MKVGRKVYRYSLYVRRSWKMKWTLVARNLKMEIHDVAREGEAYLREHYHDRGEILIKNAKNVEVYRHLRRPKMIE